MEPHVARTYLEAGPAVIKLNVGGHQFTTSKETILQDQAVGLRQSMVGSTGQVALDAEGAIFIDASPAFFDLILDYLRNGDCVMPGTVFDLEKFRHAAKRFGLLELEHKITEKVHQIQAVIASLVAQQDLSRLLAGNGVPTGASPQQGYMPNYAAQQQVMPRTATRPRTNSAGTGATPSQSGENGSKKKRYFEYAKKEWEADEMFKLPASLPDGNIFWPEVEEGDPRQENHGVVKCKLCIQNGAHNRFTEGYRGGKKNALCQHQQSNKDHKQYIAAISRMSYPQVTVGLF